MQELAQLRGVRETERPRCSPPLGEGVGSTWPRGRVQAVRSDSEPSLPSVPVSWSLDSPAVHGGCGGPRLSQAAPPQSPPWALTPRPAHARAGQLSFSATPARPVPSRPGEGDRECGLREETATFTFFWAPPLSPSILSACVPPSRSPLLSLLHRSLSLFRIRFRSDQAHGGKCRGGSRDSAGGTCCFRRPKCLAKPLPSQCHAWLFQRLFTWGKSKSALLEPPLSARPRGITWGVCLFLFFLSCICDMCVYLYICTHAHKYIYMM